MVCEPPKLCAHTTYHEQLPPRWANESAVATFRAPGIAADKSVPSRITSSASDPEIPLIAAPVATAMYAEPHAAGVAAQAMSMAAQEDAEEQQLPEEIGQSKE